MSATLQGKGLSNGIAIGQAVVMGAALLEGQHYLIEPGLVDSECHRLRQAVAQVAQDLHALRASLPSDAPPELGPLLQVHQLLASDATLLDDSVAIIRRDRYNAEWAIHTAGQALVQRFAQMPDPYLRERVQDLQQVIRQVIAELGGSPSRPWSTLSTTGDTLPFVVIAHDISPADMLNLRTQRFAGFVTETGGLTSHTAILARSMNLPAIVGLKQACAQVRDHDVVILDANQGLLLVNPAPSLLQTYQRKKAEWTQAQAQWEALASAPAVMPSGERVQLLANIDHPEEVAFALQQGAEGIGLYRTEFLFMNRKDWPSEDEQYQAYASVVKGMQGRPVTLRSLDIGADKTLDSTVAVNPALGLRAVRYCLAQPELFLGQLRAVLRAATHGPVQLLLPMIASVDEVRTVRQLLQQAQTQLQASGHDFAPVALGAMVEIPAMAIQIADFLPELDFISIGTNDLIQYTLAVDRVDDAVMALYNPEHPAVQWLLRHIIREAHKAGKPVSLCGEMAGDVRYTDSLLRMGLRCFSMCPQLIAQVKQRIVTA